jgi:hypothetical protein
MTGWRKKQIGDRIMNDWDKNNLAYMQSLNEEQFDEWMLELSEQDVSYAINLIQQARVETCVQEAELFDNVESLADARQVLSRIAARK